LEGEEASKSSNGSFDNHDLLDEDGRRPVYDGSRKFQSDLHWRDYTLFYEYFPGDNGAGLGASHQTGWTGLVAKTIQLFGYLIPRNSWRGWQVGRLLAKELHAKER
jgi:hypothetical protein